MKYLIEVCGKMIKFLKTWFYDYPYFRYTKWRLRKSIGSWMRWSIDKKTKKEILLNGFKENKSN